jgi:hypothetical protein
VNGPVELRQVVLRRPDQFVQALTEKLMMYALGRELEYFDMPQVRAVVRAAARDDYRFASVVTAIVKSDAFRMQALPHAEPNVPTGAVPTGAGVTVSVEPNTEGGVATASVQPKP